MFKLLFLNTNSRSYTFVFVLLFLFFCHSSIFPFFNWNISYFLIGIFSSMYHSIFFKVKIFHRFLPFFLSSNFYNFFHDNLKKKSLLTRGHGTETFCSCFNKDDFHSVVLKLQIGMPIHQRFSFLGDSGNWGLVFFHSSGIGESRTYSLGSLGNFQGMRSP